MFRIWSHLEDMIRPLCRVFNFVNIIIISHKNQVENEVRCWFVNLKTTIFDKIVNSEFFCVCWLLVCFLYLFKTFYREKRYIFIIYFWFSEFLLNHLHSNHKHRRFNGPNLDLTMVVPQVEIVTAIQRAHTKIDLSLQNNGSSPHPNR